MNIGQYKPQISSVLFHLIKKVQKVVVFISHVEIYKREFSENTEIKDIRGRLYVAGNMINLL